MPIDTPYNRSVTNQYNQLLRDKVAHEEATYQTVMPSPAGMYVNGYEPVMVGSGVGLYKKGKSCPKGHEVCTCGSGSAHGAGMGHGYDRVVGGLKDGLFTVNGIRVGRTFAPGFGFGSAHGGNLGLEPAVRVELALGAGMRGDATSKHGCLDMYEAYAHGGRICNRDMSEASIRCREGNKPPTRNAPKMPKRQDGTLYHKSVGGVSAAHYHRHRGLAPENARRTLALRQLGNGEGGKRGRKGKSGFNLKSIGRTLDAIDSGLGIADKLGVLGHGKSPLSSDPDNKKKKKKESSFTVDNLIKGIETAEKVGNAFEKVGNLGSKAYKGVMGLFGRGKIADKFNQGVDVLRKGKTSYDSVKDTINAVEKFKGNGKAHGKSRSEIVKGVMKKLGCSMIDASKHVKAHGLY
jgi:hypothetical protein